MAETTVSIRSLTWPEYAGAFKASFSLGREYFLVFICFSLAQLIATQVLMLIPMVGFLALVVAQAFFTVSFVGSVEALVRKSRAPQLKDLAFPYININIVQKILPLMGVLFALLLAPLVVAGLGAFYYLLSEPVLPDRQFIFISASLAVAYSAVFVLAGNILYLGVLFVLQHRLSTSASVRAAFEMFFKNMGIYILLTLVTVFPAAAGVGLVTYSLSSLSPSSAFLLKGGLTAIGLLISPFFFSVGYLLYRTAVRPPSPEPPTLIS